jgi:3-phenylpropionate/trans-cinnamate dioxygenase ferredoxin subunit
MTWLKASCAGTLEDGRACVEDLDGRRLLVCRVDGAYYAIDDVCTHDGGSLDQGFLDGTRVECPRHGARFDVTTGRALTLPAVRPVKTYPTRVDDGVVEVELP